MQTFGKCLGLNFRFVRGLVSIEIRRRKPVVLGSEHRQGRICIQKKPPEESTMTQVEDANEKPRKDIPTTGGLNAYCFELGSSGLKSYSHTFLIESPLNPKP